MSQYLYIYIYTHTYTSVCLYEALSVAYSSGSLSFVCKSQQTTEFSNRSHPIRMSHPPLPSLPPTTKIFNLWPLDSHTVSINPVSSFSSTIYLYIYISKKYVHRIASLLNSLTGMQFVCRQENTTICYYWCILYQ